MKLPNWESAYVPLTKLDLYLLSETHPVGKAKAVLLRNLGYDDNNVDTLQRGLIAIARDQDVAEVMPSEYGTKYVIDGPLQTPGGTALQLRTVWIIEAGQNRPRFVTAYPV
jgi:hypothetical protein